MISKSEYSSHSSSAAKSDVQQVVMYCKEKLIRGEVEFSFEELRAQKYNQRRKHEQWGTYSLTSNHSPVTELILIPEQFHFWSGMIILKDFSSLQVLLVEGSHVCLKTKLIVGNKADGCNIAFVFVKLFFHHSVCEFELTVTKFF